MRNGDLFQCYKIIRDLYRVSDQSWFRFVTLPTETDAGSLVDFSLFVMEKGFRYDSCIKECQRAAVPVPFLEW